MAKVLVTGGAGFIGSHLVDALLARGDQVRVFDNFSSGDRENLVSVKDDVEIVEGDLRDQKAVAAAVAGQEIIFHEAAFVSLPESIVNPRDCFEVNVTGTFNLLDAARLAGVGRVMLASSAAVYGTLDALPLSESLPLQTLSPYASSKAFNEALAQQYSASYGLPVVALRYFNVYGPRQSPNSEYAAVIPKFIERLKQAAAPIVYGDGKQTRDFIAVQDVVRANLLAAESAEAAGRALNICSGVETSLLDLLAALYEIFPDAPQPEHAEPRLGDVPRSVGDPALARQILGFESEISLQEGLASCVEGAAA